MCDVGVDLELPVYSVLPRTEEAARRSHELMCQVLATPTGRALIGQGVMGLDDLADIGRRLDAG